MARLVIPPLDEIIANPRLLESVPPHALPDILKRLELVYKHVGTSVEIAPDPATFAISHPRFSWMNAPHIRYLGERVAEAIDSCSAIIVTMPPRHAKSHVCSVWTPFWFLAQNPEAHVVLVSYEAHFARKWGAKVRTLIQTYGKQYGLELHPTKKAADDWELITGGGMSTIGVGGGLAGRPVKLLILDDLLKGLEDARTKQRRDDTWDWWENSALQRIEPDTATIIIGTRYHEDDYIGRMIEHSRAGDGLQVSEITLRAIAETDDPLDRPLGQGLWTTHPEPAGGVWGQDFYDQRKKVVSPAVWSSVYQQRPSPPGGNKVDPAWWRYAMPQELEGLKFEDEIQSWDLALDAEKDGDSYHTGLIMKRAGARIYIFDAYHEYSQIAAAPLVDPLLTPQTKSVITTIRTWKRLHPKIRYQLVERSLAGPMLIQTLQYEMSGMLPWPPKGTTKGSKEANLEACIPEIQSGSVFLVLNRDGTQPRWIAEFIEEHRSFPKAPHNDYVDSFTQGMNFLLPQVRAAVGSDHAEALTHRPAVDAPTAHAQTLHQALRMKMEERLGPVKEQLERLQRRGLPNLGFNTGDGIPTRRKFRGMY